MYNSDNMYSPYITTTLTNDIRKCVFSKDQKTVLQWFRKATFLSIYIKTEINMSVNDEHASVRECK